MTRTHCAVCNKKLNGVLMAAEMKYCCTTMAEIFIEKERKLQAAIGLIKLRTSQQFVS
jgi:hypothetical protein